jgi:hypothetical protein
MIGHIEILYVLRDLSAAVGCRHHMHMNSLSLKFWQWDPKQNGPCERELRLFPSVEVVHRS